MATPTPTCAGIARLAFLVAAAALAGCSKTSARPPPPDEALAVLVSGCASLVTERSGVAPACVLGADRRVRLHVPSEGGDRIDLHLGEAASPPAASKSVAGGRLFTVTVAPGTRTLEVRRVDASGKRAGYTLALAGQSRPAWFDEAQALRQKGDLDGAESRTQAAMSAATATDADRAMGEGLLARIAMRRGKTDEADRRFRDAIALDKRTGRVSDRADDAFALVFLLHQRSRRYPDARRVLDDVAGELDAYPDGRAREPLYRGQVAWEAGDTRGALRQLALAIERADRLGAEGISRAARQVQGMVMCNTGSSRSCLLTLREAERELERAEGVTPCERADVAISLGYAELEEAETSRSKDVHAGAADARALGFLDAGCPDTYLRALALEHLALASVLENDPTRAKERLAEAKANTSEPRISDALFWLDVEAKIAALEKRSDAALAAFDIERLQAAASQRDGEMWRALVGRGHVLEATKRTKEALEAYRAAEDVLEDAIVAVPFGEGRSSVSAETRESAQRAAAILLALGRDQEALDVVRRARTRVARSLARADHVAALTGGGRESWERAVADYRTAREELDAEAAGDWKMARPALEAATAARKARHAKLRGALDDAMALVGGARSARALPALPAGELVLAYADLGGELGVMGFVVEGGRVRAFRASAAADAGARDALLAPVSKEIERATRVRVLVEGALAGIDVHALTWDGMPLIVHAPVVYGLDLGPSGRSTPGRAALVVSDPTGDLPSARDEGKAAFALLAKRYDARAITGGDATAAHVREALRGVALLHYAGHGVFAGREGAESALPLARGGSLTVGDVLALPGAPDRVILSGCEAGRQLGAREEGAAGLASAFLLAGADEVVAPVRVVDDHAASALSRDLHAALDARSSNDLAAALREAQVRSFRDGRPGWEAFRAFAR
jgi:tetratricopeptide (TPR) repeat protein